MTVYRRTAKDQNTNKVQGQRTANPQMTPAVRTDCLDAKWMRKPEKERAVPPLRRGRFAFAAAQGQRWPMAERRLRQAPHPPQEKHFMRADDAELELFRR